MITRNLLFIYYSNPIGLHTIQDNVENFQLLSKHNIKLLNTYPKITIPNTVNLNDFDGIVIDSTLSYFPKTLDTIDKDLSIKLENYDGIKILLKQDEHISSHETARIIGEKKIDIVFTCLDESQIPKVYPRNLVGEVKFIQQLTGYISETLINSSNSMNYTRCIDISYRGSMQPLQCGRLGYEKWNIGERCKIAFNNATFKTDISSNWSDRINGNDWIKFLSCSKGVLGVESGSNLFDFDGSVEKKCHYFEQENNILKNNHEIFYKKAHEEFLYKYEDNVQYAQISPRHFEAAASRTLQILYEGNYSNIFIPYKHYLPLKRDFSNFDEIQDILFNSSKRLQITECAYEEIVMNEKFHYKKRLEDFDFLIEQISSEKNVKQRNSNTNIDKKNIIILVPHQPHLDPRIRWLKEGFEEFADVSIVGTTNLTENNIKWLIKNEYTVESNLSYKGLTEQNDDCWENIYSDFYALKRLLNDLCSENKIKFPESSFYSMESINRANWYFKFFNKTDIALRFTTEHLINANGTSPDLLVCCDLSSLLPGVILAQKYKVPLIYDAHEFWAYSDVKYMPWEIDFWLYYERVLLKYVDFPITVSKFLAEKMSKLYETNFDYIPNVEIKRNYINLNKRSFKPDLLFDDCYQLPDFANTKYVKFLFMGGFAPGRGLETLIDIWRFTSKNNLLILRGMHIDYTNSLIERAKSYNLYNKTIFFFKPVSESELVSMASTFDVGIIPYDQNTNTAYKYCCPNKLSQYMAAGLPILSNKLIAVEKIIKEANCGFSVNFDLNAEFIEIINKLNDLNLRKTLGNAARKYFLSTYNWEFQTENFHRKLKKMMNQNNKTKIIKIDIRHLPNARNKDIIVDNKKDQNSSYDLNSCENNVNTDTNEIHNSVMIFKINSYIYFSLKHLVTRKIKIFNPILRKIKSYY